MTERSDRAVSRIELARAVDEAWPKAQRHWSRFLLLKDPIDDAAQPSVAQIDLAKRQVMVNGEMIADRGLIDSVEAILAHEVGHHVRYPGSLTVEARLRLLESQLMPFDGYSVVNQFEDLMINERLGRTMRDELIAVYQAFTGDEAFHAAEPWKNDPGFLFYLAIYEELWRLDPGELIGPAEPEFARSHPSYRAEAQVLAQNLFNLGPNLYTQFLYFLSVMLRYIGFAPGSASLSPYACRCGEPGAEDWADALIPDAREREALRRAADEGWLTDEQRIRVTDGDLGDRIAGLPGFGDVEDAALIPEIMAAYYRRQAERFLFRPPRQPTLGEAIVPTTVDDWHSGDAVRDIDWLATLIQRGDTLGGATPLVRTKVAEHEGLDISMWRPRVEIYLDVSGSMPDPRYSENAMTLAAQILVAGTIRAGGWVRMALYSSSPVTSWEWCRSESEMSRFLMHYVGGGTEFPFALLESSVEECRAEQPIRVVISDPDFDRNYDACARAPAIFGRAASASNRMILLLHRPWADKLKRYRDAGASVVEVEQMDDFPSMAADLTFALFPDGMDVK